MFNKLFVLVKTKYMLISYVQSAGFFFVHAYNENGEMYGKMYDTYCSLMGLEYALNARF